MGLLSLESLVLAAILDDGISPGFIRNRLVNLESYVGKYLSENRIDPPGIEEITAVLANALDKGLVTCRHITEGEDKSLRELPPGPFDDDVLTYELWFELSPEGEKIALRTFETLRELEHRSA